MLKAGEQIAICSHTVMHTVFMYVTTSNTISSATQCPVVHPEQSLVYITLSTKQQIQFCYERI